MKKRFSLLICLILIICISFSGCDLTVTSVDSLLRPPKLSGENSLLQKAFEESVSDNKSIIMKTPVNGENKSSYLLYDIDNDNSNEAIVFFSDTSVDDYVNMSIFKYENANWKYLSTVKGMGEEIVEIDFADLNGDKVKELIISWAYIDKANLPQDSFYGYNGDRTISIYNYENNTISLIKSFPYTNIYIYDFDKNGTEDLFFIAIDLSKRNSRTKGRIISFKENYSIEIKKEFKLSNIIEVLNVSFDEVKIDESKYTRIFIDGTSNESAIITDIIMLNQDDFSLIFPLEEINSSDSPLTIRNNKIHCTDIDGDGIIEIPMAQVLNKSNIESGSLDTVFVNLTVWCSLENKELVPEFKCIYNSVNNYMFRFPDEWIQNVNVVYDRTDSSLSFYLIDENNLEISKKIFMIKTFSELKWNNDKENYTKLASVEAVVYGYKIFDNEFITSEIIENYFEILN